MLSLDGIDQISLTNNNSCVWYTLCIHGSCIMIIITNKYRWHGMWVIVIFGQHFRVRMPERSASTAHENMYISAELCVWWIDELTSWRCDVVDVCISHHMLVCWLCNRHTLITGASVSWHMKTASNSLISSSDAVIHEVDRRDKSMRRHWLRHISHNASKARTLSAYIHRTS